MRLKLKRTRRTSSKYGGVYICCVREYCGVLPLQAKKLEAREQELKKRDALYQEHVAKLEAKVSRSQLILCEGAKPCLV